LPSPLVDFKALSKSDNIFFIYSSVFASYNLVILSDNVFTAISLLLSDLVVSASMPALILSMNVYISVFRSETTFAASKLLLAPKALRIASWVTFVPYNAIGN